MSRSRGHSPTTSSPGAVGSHASFDRTLLRPDGKRRAASTVVGHDATRERGNSDRREPNPGGGDLARGRLDRAAPSLSPPRSRPPPGHKRDTDFSSHCCGCPFSAALKPYRGETLVYNDMLGERVDVFFGNISGAFALYLDGKLKVLAVLDKARNAAMPDVPTSAEVALPGLLSGVWYAMVGPPRLKPELQDQIAKATIEVLKMPDVQQRFRKLNVEPDGGTPAETAAFIKSEVRRWGEVIRANHIMAE